MRIALASARTVDRDIERNLAEMERYAAEAAGKNADLICFGEAFLQGFNALDWDFEADRKMAVAADSDVFGRVCGMTLKYGVDILFGYNELDGEHIYSSCALVSGGRLYHNYRRISKGWKEYWKTDGHYLEGDRVFPFEYRGKKVVIGLCGDLWEYPDRFALGQDVLIWPVYVDWTEEEWNGGGRQEYADQANLCCADVLYVNAFGDDGTLGGAMHFAGGSVREELLIGCEGLLMVEI